MSDTAIVVFAREGATAIINRGGTEAWKLDANRARACDYLVCVQNCRGGGSPQAPHGAAFLVGRTSDVEKVDGDDVRWRVRISAYAKIDIPNAWDGGRNPVRYTTLQELGIDPAPLRFEPIPQCPA